jgi:hypothetical protein
MLPAWWRERGIEPIGKPEDSLWPSAAFMDTLQHAGPGVSYAFAMKTAHAIQGWPSSQDRLLVPPHPPQQSLPFAHKRGADVEVYLETELADQPVRDFLHSGGRVFVATAELAATLRQRGFKVQRAHSSQATPADVWQRHRGEWISACVKPGQPAVNGLSEAPAGKAWAGLWREGKWQSATGDHDASYEVRPTAPLLSGVPIEYRYALQASPTGCQLWLQQRDRAPSATSIVRMQAVDTRMGIITGLYNFGADLRFETEWLGVVETP